jgi:uncharacterized protein (TIGR03435 family)
LRVNTLRLYVAAVAIFTLPAAFSQNFEVASVKPSGPDVAGGRFGSPPRRVGGPGTSDPERLAYSRYLMRGLLVDAFGVEADQILGPAWIDSEKFDIEAIVPQGATKEQSIVMLRNLLMDRFKITAHNETREFPSYTLTVAKNGSKLKVTTAGPDDIPLTFPVPQPTLDSDGFPITGPGRTGWWAMNSGVSRVTCRGCSISDLIQRIGLLLATTSVDYTFVTRARVVDKSGLSGKYDYHLEFGGGGLVGSALNPQYPTARATPVPISLRR